LAEIKDAQFRCPHKQIANGAKEGRPRHMMRSFFEKGRSAGSWKRRRFLPLAAAAGLLAAFTLWPISAPSAEERVLRLHHFMPEKSPQHRDIFLPWSRKIAQASNGRLRIDVAAAMQLGGKPADLISQVETHQVDIVWTVAGYTPGKFARLEVFELPWIASSRASATSQALHEFYETHARDELARVHLLAVWCHPSGVIMNRDEPVLRPGDAAGRVLRVPSVVIGEAFRSVGAEPKFMPAPQVLAQLQDNAIGGALFPYEVIPTLKLTGQIRHITEFAGDRGLYTSVFLLAMSKRAYSSLDMELRKVIDAHSGAALSAEFGRMWDDIEEAGREDFAAAGGVVTFVKNDDYAAWQQASRSANDAWVAKVGRLGIDGTKLVVAAKELVAKYTMLARPY
jgi:TRAP-type C4-dicarboxylate transport system substrate-binding protein